MYNIQSALSSTFRGLCAVGETIPDGWNIKREASNNQPDLGAIDMKVMIPSGWNSQREVSNV